MKSMIDIKRILLVTLGSVITGISMNLFLESNKIAPGGVSGLAIVLHNLWGWPTGLVMLAANIPLFLLGVWSFGKEYGAYTLLCILVMSFATDYIPVQPLTDNLMLASIFGGVMMGAGLGITLNGGGNSGGTVMAARLVQRWFLKHMSITWILFAIDSIVVIFSGFAFGADIAMYALITLYISSKVLDLVVEGFSTAKAVYIISPRLEDIAKKVLHEMERGVTRLEATGMYTQKEHDMLMCVLENSREVGEIKDMVREMDENAFVIVSDVREVMGEGFKPKAGH